jgi:hypothetical protein
LEEGGCKPKQAPTKIHLGPELEDSESQSQQLGLAMVGRDLF